MFFLEGFALTGGAGPGPNWGFCLLGEVWTGPTWDILQILHVLGLDMTFGDDFLMIMYGFFNVERSA